MKLDPMLSRSNRYLHYVTFETTQDDKNALPPYLFWGAVVILFIVTNIARNRAIIALNAILRRLPNSWIASNGGTEQDFTNLASNIFAQGILPFKAFFYFLGVLVIAYPVILCIYQARKVLLDRQFKKRAQLAGLIFLGVSLLIVPFRQPWGTGSMGIAYAFNSWSPFDLDAGWYYRRLLMTAIANFIQLKGPILYYIFSLFCTYVLIYMSLLFIDQKVLEPTPNEEGEQRQYTLTLQQRLIWYLSIATSSYIIHQFQFPGYTEQFFFILLLLPACIPMTRQGRLGVLTLALATHEASMFVFIPMVLFCFPWREIVTALSVIPVYIFFWMAGNGFMLTRTVGGQLTVQEKSGLQYLLENFGMALTGLFFTYKLLWIVLAYVAWLLWRKGESLLAVAMLSFVLFPAILMLPMTVDTSRMLGFGFFGLLIAFSIIIREYQAWNIPKWIGAIVIANLILPSYYVGLNTGFQSYTGLYKLLSFWPSKFVP